MKKWLAGVSFLCVSIACLAQAKLPQPQGWVNDFSGVLSSSQKTQLEALLKEVESKTTAEISIVILNTVKPLDIETYAVELFEKWGIGKRAKDNGLLILVALKDRKVRIETGYGLEGIIPDALAKQIIERLILPEFKNNYYFEGVYKASLFIADILAKEYGVKIQQFSTPPSYRIIPKRRTSPLGALLSLLFFIFIFGSRWGFLWWFLLGARPGYWYSGGSSFGGGFSGFSGFGGGLSGGGGASGSW